MALNSVVLPAPLSPTTETNSPAWTWIETSSSACALPYWTLTLSTSRNGVARIAERGFRPRRGLDAAAEIDPPHGLVAHHLFGGALGDALADIHRDDAVDEARRRF